LIDARILRRKKTKVRQRGKCRAAFEQQEGYSLWGLPESWGGISYGVGRKRKGALRSKEVKSKRKKAKGLIKRDEKLRPRICVSNKYLKKSNI